MNLSYAIYERASGYIDGIFSGASNTAYMQVARRRGYSIIKCNPGVSEITHYVDEGDWPRKLREREPLTPGLAIDGYTATITGLAAGLTAHVAGHEVLTDAGPLVITFDVPGTYRLSLSGIARYRDKTMEITIDGDD